MPVWFLIERHSAVSLFEVSNVFFVCVRIDINIKIQLRNNLPELQLVSMVIWWASLIQS